MGIESVQLHDLPGSSPVAIDLKSPPSNLDPIVEARPRQVMTAQKWQEALLEGATGSPRRQFGNASKAGPNPPHATPSWIAVEQLV